MKEFTKKTAIIWLGFALVLFAGYAAYTDWNQRHHRGVATEGGQ